MKDPNKMTADELIELADEIKGNMTTRVMKEMAKLRSADKLIGKRMISKKEAILIADGVKSGMSIDVFNDLKEIERSRPRVLLAQ